MLNNISELIHAKRVAMGMTIEQLAESANVSVSLISRLERGHVINISINKLATIATALNLEVSDFFVQSNLSGIRTVQLLKYLSSLPPEERERLAGHILGLIKK